MNDKLNYIKGKGTDCDMRRDGAVKFGNARTPKIPGKFRLCPSRFELGAEESSECTWYYLGVGIKYYVDCFIFGELNSSVFCL